jgi:DNA-binding CsgD family transcriptional regulator
MQIAEKLFISKNTVDRHRKNILQKTGTKTSLEAVFRGIENGWI